MKNVVSVTASNNERAFADLIATLDGEAAGLEHAVDHLGRMKCVDCRHVRALGFQVTPAFFDGGIDIVDYGETTSLEYAREVTRVEIDHTELELNERVGRKDHVQPRIALER